MKREFLMLASTYKETDYIAEWFVSEKLDGMRVWWDGGMSRGLLKASVPWANNDKDDRYKEPPVSTGLWTRYGNVIHAPDYWLDGLPKIPLDGELYVKGHRQHMMSTVKKLVPDNDAWAAVGYHVFDMPPLSSVLQPGVIKTTNSYQYWSEDSRNEFLLEHVKKIDHTCKPDTPLVTRLKVMQRYSTGGPAVIHPQHQLTTKSSEARDEMLEILDNVVSNNGEGLIIRAPFSKWEPHRVKHMLKVKPFDDMEVKVVGYITGKGKHLGRMGALIVECSYGQFAVGGFTDAERRLSEPQSDYASQNPGSEQVGCSTAVFAVGDIITIKHRGFSADRIPQEARYWRPRNEV